MCTDLHVCSQVMTLLHRLSRVGMGGLHSLATIAAQSALGSGVLAVAASVAAETTTHVGGPVNWLSRHVST
jgi:uncharacterized protein YaaW (UPF0174 family)